VGLDGGTVGIFDRFSKLIQSNATAAGNAVGGLQDPAKEVEQLVLDMEAALKKARGETQQSMAAEKLARNRLAAAERELPTWTARAEEALRQNDEDLAREAQKNNLQGYD
jgi:phage shock protein A